jgi:hypothetical protein
MAHGMAAKMARKRKHVKEKKSCINNKIETPLGWLPDAARHFFMAMAYMRLAGNKTRIRARDNAAAQRRSVLARCRCLRSNISGARQQSGGKHARQAIAGGKTACATCIACGIWRTALPRAGSEIAARRRNRKRLHRALAPSLLRASRRHRGDIMVKRGGVTRRRGNIATASKQTDRHSGTASRTRDMAA